ncbi:hypothetical protein BBH99_08790 [Chryseobacterium contaminans]|uniref:Uncharacterized protein n=2 Tax=Chryseobacterium contaminans TaxID=1423959 RepID=A0A1M6YH63_9FLAO|nr:hypothetical protein BBH99_08790 [Chryseobacterium contaminans]SHL17482.1 hypothetical protein SAMN05444407_102513 [Chryseobacterium contaminans]
MSNNDLLETSQKKSNDIVFKIIVPLLGLLFVVINPLSLFAISALLGILLYIIVFRKTIFSKLFLFSLAAIYTVILFIYSVSPKIQYMEFITTHPHWVEVDGNSFRVNVNWQGSKNRRSVADITYQYRINHKFINASEKNVLKNNAYSIFWNSKKEKNESNQKLKKRVESYIQKKNFKILKNPDSEESRLFIPLDNVLFSNSFGIQFLVTISKIMLIPFFCFLILFFWKDNHIKNSK